MSSILASIDSSLASLDRSKDRYIALGAILRPIADQIEGIAKAHDAHCIVMAEQLIVSMPLKSFKDCLPLLEALEVFLNIDFDQTYDTDSYRKYSCSQTSWIRVDGEVSIEDPDNPDATLKCKRVLTGKFNTYPEYKLVCEE